MKTSAIITFITMAIAPLAAADIFRGDHCKIVGHKGCETNGNHVLRCEVRDGNQEWTQVANCGTRQHCAGAKCVDN